MTESKTAQFARQSAEADAAIAELPSWLRRLMYPTTRPMDPWARISNLEQAAYELTRGGEHEGWCDEDLDGPCEQHLEASARRRQHLLAVLREGHPPMDFPD